MEAIFALSLLGCAYWIYLQAQTIAELRARIARADRENDDVDDALHGRRKRQHG